MTAPNPQITLADAIRANPALLDELPPDDLAALDDWPSFLTIRPQQDGLLDSPCPYVVLQAGRRGGKGFSLGHAGHLGVHKRGYRRLLIAGTTASDTRDGIVDTILSGGPASQRPTYEPSLRLLTWPNGATGQVRYAAEPSTFRGVVKGGIGPDLVLIDELAAWKPVRGEHAFEVLEFTLLDASTAPPKMLIATTPKPTSLMRDLTRRGDAEVRRWSTRDNAAHLDKARLESLYARYGGTRLGRQELEGQLLDDYEGALWTWEMLETAERRETFEPADAQRIVVAIDPAVSTNADSDYTAIAVAGKRGQDGVLFHAEHGRWHPNEWAKRAIMLYQEWNASALVAEINNGGQMVEHTIRMAGGPPVKTIHASKGKEARAEPVALLYEKGRIAHAPGLPLALTDEMTAFPVASEHDDLVDAVVYALSHLLVEPQRELWALV